MDRIAKFATALVIAAALGGCTRIQPGYVGIVVKMSGTDRGVESYPVTTGRVFYNPFNTSIYEYPTFVQQVVLTHDENEGRPIDDEITFTNKDQMTISADISFAYSLERDKVPAFYVRFRNDNLDAFTHGYLKSLIRDKFNEVGGRYSIADIMGNNGPFLKEVHDAVQAEVAPLGVLLDPQFGFIGAPRPPQAVIQSINAKAQAQQIALQKQMEVQQAQADALKQVAQAQGYADALAKRSEAEAEANKRISASLTPELVEWQKIQRWNGTLPTFTGGGAIPFINAGNGGGK